MLHRTKRDQLCLLPKRKSLLVDLALQGGGAHGAFTWGVLDRLLEEPWLTFDGISGTSAGAMNAAVWPAAMPKAAPTVREAALEDFWKRVSDASHFSPMRRGPMEMLTGQWTLDNSPMYHGRRDGCRASSRPTT